VLTIVHLIEGLGRGGAERRLVNDVKYLDKARFRNIVCTLGPPHHLVPEIRSLGIPVHCLDSSSSASPMKRFSRLIRLLRRHRADILHTQLFRADIYGRLARLVCRPMIVITTLQGSEHEPGTEYLYSAKRRLAHSLTGICNDAFVAVSAFVKESAMRNLRLSADRIRIIPNSVDIEEFPNIRQGNANGKREELGISPQERVILTVGRLDPPKGHRFLFLAAGEILRAFPELKLLVVGDGPSRSSLEALARELGIAEKVVFTGVRPDVRELLSLADVFVLPTLSEGMPVTLLESLASGVPAVASRIGPTEEVIEDGVNGLLVPPRSPEALADAVLVLLRNSERAQAMAERGRLLVHEKFSARGCAEALTGLYLSLAEERPG
jgi:glycosyltransferase involved in cell wall biosynthesis